MTTLVETDMVYSVTYLHSGKLHTVACAAFAM